MWLIPFSAKKPERLKAGKKAEVLKELSKEQISEQYTPYPMKTHYIDAEEKQKHMKKYVTVKQALEDLDEPEQSADISQQKYSKAKSLKQRGSG